MIPYVKPTFFIVIIFMQIKQYVSSIDVHIMVICKFTETWYLYDAILL